MKCDRHQLLREILFWGSSLFCLCGGMAIGGYPFKEAFFLAAGFLPGTVLTAFFAPRGRHSEMAPLLSGLIILAVVSLILAFAFEGFIASLLFFDRSYYGLRGLLPFSENPLFISTISLGLFAARWMMNRSLIDDRSVVFISDRKHITIPASTITHIRSFDSYTEVYTSDRNCFLVWQSLNDWMNQLPEKKFYRVHRSYIVNREHIAEAHMDSLLLDNGDSIPRSRIRKEENR